MKKPRRSSQATAQLIAINAALYGKERDRQVTRYRFSVNALRLLSNRTAIRESFLMELEEEMAELNWLFVRLGTEYAAVSLEKSDTWVKLGVKRLKDADQDYLLVSESDIEKAYDDLYPPEDPDEALVD